MSRVKVTLRVAGRASEAEELWYDLQRWPAWVDGLKSIAKVEGDWPHSGARVVWDSHPGGRGRVVERVSRYEPRIGQTLLVEDEQVTGKQVIALEPEGTHAVLVTLTLDYEIKTSSAFTPLVDRFFVRRSMRESLRRTLHRFARELEADRTEY